MRSIFFCLPLFGASPALSFVIGDDTTAQRVFHATPNDPSSLDRSNTPGGHSCFWDQSQRGGNLEVLDTAGWLKSISEAQDEPSESISKHHHHRKEHEHPPPSDPHEPHLDSSLLDLISSSKHSSAFYETIKDDKDITDLLKDKNKNTTVFVPSNAAFECLDKYRKHHDLPKDLLQRILQYHFAPGMHDWDDLMFHNTLLTMLREDDLGKGHHQRLRVGPGPRINLYAHFKMVDIYAGNGVIHAINAILLPPPDIADIVKILPTVFSTSEAALARTGLTDELPKLSGKGGTVFLPTNKHWKQLGFVINAFLFSDHGTPYLRALMKYHVVPGYSLYSDALVINEDSKSLDERDDPDGLTHGYSHSWIPTLLKDKHISADIHRFARFLSFRANGLNSIIFSDGIARNGVIQVPDHILIPPHTLADHRDPPKMAGEEGESNDWLSVSELKEILEPMVGYDNSEYEL